MLEVKMMPSEARTGRGFLNAASTGLKKGKFVKLNGVWAADAGPSGYEGDPGYAKAGDIKFDPCNSGVGVGTKVGVMNKLNFRPDSSDLTLDTVVSGAGILVYYAGWFETDQYDTTLNTAPAYGTLLFVGSNSELTTGVGLNARPVARFWGKSTTFDSNYTATGMVWFELLDNDYPNLSPSH